MKKYRSFIIIIFLMLGSQAFAYFLTKTYINDYNTITTIINFPFISIFVYFYDSWYPFIILCTFLVYKNDQKLFGPLIFTMLFSTILAYITFIIYPSVVIRPDIEVNGLTSWLIDFTYRTDTPAVNCLPSMHCTYCFVTSFYIIKTKNIDMKNKLFTITFSFLIVLSTLFIKQHIIEDVILAFIYTTISVILVYINNNRIIKMFDKITMENYYSYEEEK